MYITSRNPPLFLYLLPCARLLSFVDVQEATVAVVVLQHQKGQRSCVAFHRVRKLMMYSASDPQAQNAVAIAYACAPVSDFYSCFCSYSDFVACDVPEVGFDSAGGHHVSGGP